MFVDVIRLRKVRIAAKACSWQDEFWNSSRVTFTRSICWCSFTAGCHCNEMNFTQRLSRYLIGVGIGTLAVFLMFPNYNWLSWTPQNRVLQEIIDKKFSIDTSLTCSQGESGMLLSEKNILENADVNFELSNTKSSPRNYWITFDGCELLVEVGDSAAKVISISSLSSCKCVVIKND